MPENINRLLELSRDRTEKFDIAEAERLVEEVDINAPFLDPWLGYETAFLLEAADYSNLKMTRLLLRHGADPNIICDYENALWSLQYCEYNDLYDDEEALALADEKRLEIARLVLEYGADPCINVERDNLFSWVLYEVFNDTPGRLLDYRSRFFILLVAYGGKDNYCVPKIFKQFDKSDMKKYKFLRIIDDEGNLTGRIVDENREIVAEI